MQTDAVHSCGLRSRTSARPGELGIEDELGSLQKSKLASTAACPDQSTLHHIPSFHMISSP